MPYSVNIKYIDLMLNTAILPISNLEFDLDKILKDTKLKEQDNEIDISKKLEERNKRIKEGIYPILNKKMHIYSVDEIDMFWELFYPKKSLIEYQENISMYYLNLINNLAKTFISHRDGRIVFKYWETECNEYFKAYKGVTKVLLWNSLNKYFATDILGIMYLLENGIDDEEDLEGYYSRVALEDMQLESVLNKGTAETHLHVSASTDFYQSWKNLMNLYNKDPKVKCYDQLIGNNELGNNYKAASIIRMFLAYYLVNKKMYSKDMCFECFYENLFESLINKSDDELKEKRNIFYTTDSLLEVYTDILSGGLKAEKYDGNDLENIFKVLFEEILDINLNYDSDETGGLKNSKYDLLNYILFDNYKSDINTYTENVFLMRCLKYLKKSSGDTLFAKWFIYYLRVKNEFYSLMIQGNKIKGLDNFVNYFTRSTKIGRNNETKVCWYERFDYQLRDKNLKKLEIRISPESVYKIEGNKEIKKDFLRVKNKMYAELLDIFKSYKKILEDEAEICEDECGKEGQKYKHIMPIPYLGIIYHFIKMPDLPVERKCWVDYKKEGEINSLYYQKIRETYKIQAKAIMRIREEIPHISKYIVGIDGASIENNTDPWVFAPVYEILRDSKNAFRKNKESIKTLGFTFHAGEDFRHILTGLRRIDETIDRYKYHSGDRIGHGIALGIDISKWRAKHPVVIMPRMEHLENLIWVWGSCKKFNTNVDMGYMERKIIDLAKEVYVNVEGLTIYNLWEAYEEKFLSLDDLGDKFKLSEYKESCENFEFAEITCCPNIEGDYDSWARGYWNKEKLKHAQHCKVYLERMLEPIHVGIPHDKIDILKEMQKLVVRKVSSRGIIVETNPTSNASLGEIENVFEHYITRLNSLEKDDSLKSLMISINTDDPSVFNTNLSSEFAYIFYSLVEKGHSKEEVLKWIDKIRRHGMDSSFIRNRNESPREILKELNDMIREITNQTGIS